MNIQFKRRLVLASVVVLFIGTNAFSDLGRDYYWNYGQSASAYQNANWNYEGVGPTFPPAQTRTYPMTPRDVQQVNTVRPAAPAVSTQPDLTAPVTLEEMHASGPTVTTSAGSAANPTVAAVTSTAPTAGAATVATNQQILTERHAELQAAAATSCLAGISNVNHACAETSKVQATSAMVSVPVPAAPLVLGSCATQRVSVPGSHQYASEFMEKIVSAPNANPPALFGISADLSSAAVKSNQEAMHISKSTDGGKTWTEVSKIKSDYYSISDGLYNGLGVSVDGKNIAFTTKKGVFALNPNGNPTDAFTKLSPADDSQPAATDVQISPDGKHMAASYGFFDQKATVVTYHLENGAWKKDMIAPITSGSNVISLQYDPSGKLYAGTGNQVFAFNTASSQWNQIPITLSGTTKTQSGKTITTTKAVNDVSVYGMTFTQAGTAPNFTYKPNLAATCWGVFNLPAQTISRGRTYSVVANPKNPMQVVRTTAMGASFSTDGGKTWNPVPGLPECESTVTPGQMITKSSSAACADTWNVKTGKTPAHAKMDPELYPSEFRTAQFNDDGTLLISGTSGTFLTNPFSTSCK
jgi:hypothetical protein